MATVYEKLKKAGIDFFDATPYPVQVGCYWLEDAKKYQKITGKKFIDDAGDAHGRCTSFSDGAHRIILIGIAKSARKGTLAHECYHALNAIYLWFGCYHDRDNDEPAAYLLGYLACRCSERFS